MLTTIICNICSGQGFINSKRPLVLLVCNKCDGRSYVEIYETKNYGTDIAELLNFIDINDLFDSIDLEYDNILDLDNMFSFI